MQLTIKTSSPEELLFYVTLLRRAKLTKEKVLPAVAEVINALHNSNKNILGSSLDMLETIYDDLNSLIGELKSVQ